MLRTTRLGAVLGAISLGAVSVTSVLYALAAAELSAPYRWCFAGAFALIAALMAGGAACVLAFAWGRAPGWLTAPRLVGALCALGFLATVPLAAALEFAHNSAAVTLVALTLGVLPLAAALIAERLAEQGAPPPAQD